MAMEGTVQSIEVSAAPQFVFEVALHLEAYPEWVTGVKSVDILEEDDFGRPIRVAFVADAMIKEISYTLRYVYDLDNGFSWHAEPGRDIKAMDGSYEFNEMADGRLKPAIIITGSANTADAKPIVEFTRLPPKSANAMAAI